MRILLAFPLCLLLAACASADGSPPSSGGPPLAMPSFNRGFSGSTSSGGNTGFGGAFAGVNGGVGDTSVKASPF